MKKYIIISMAFLILVSTNVLIYKSNRRLKEDNDRLKNNQTALIEKNRQYTGRIREMTLTIDEFKENFPKLQEELRKEKIKTKHLKDITSTKTQIIIEKKIPVYDTIFIKETGDTTKALIFNYKDQWNTINGMVAKDTADISFQGKDTLDIIAYRVPRKFLFFNCKTKYIEVRTTNRNPNIEITAQERIAIRKRKKTVEQF